MPARRTPYQFRSGHLTPQDAAALNQMGLDLYRLVGGFSTAPGLKLSEDANGIRIALTNPSAGGGNLSVQDMRYCTRLLQGCGAQDGSIAVQSNALFPAPPFTIKIDKEQLQVNAGPPGSTVWSVTRGFNGTSAAPHVNYTPVCQIISAIQTTLTFNVATDDTSINVASSAQFPPWDRYFIQVDNEIMLVTDGAGGTSWTVTRAQMGTAAANHNAGATVSQSLPDLVESATTLIFDELDFVQPAEQNGKVVAVHKEVAQVVRILSTAQTGNGYYAGYLQVWDSVNRKWLDSYPVWVKDLNI